MLRAYEESNSNLKAGNSYVFQVLPLARVNLSEEERRAKVANLEEATRKLEQRDEERQQLTSQVG